MNNQGHGIMKQTINTWLDGNYNAVNEESGLYFPDFNKVAEAYGIEATNIYNHNDIKNKIQNVLDKKGPVFCNVHVNPEQQIKPKLKFGEDLDDLWPYLNENGE